MSKRVACAGVAIFSAAFAFSVQAQTPAIQPLAGDGVELPAYGAHLKITNVFVNLSGNLVLQFTYEAAGRRLVDFYDTATGKRLMPDDEQKLARSKAVLDEAARAHALTVIRPEGTLKLRDGTTVDATTFSGHLCEGWPFESYLEITRPHQESIDESVVVVLPTMQKENYACGRDVGEPGPIDFTSEAVLFDLYDDESGGFFGVTFEHPYVIHFDAEGKSAFFHGRQDIVLLSAQGLRNLVDIEDGFSADDAQKSSQALVDQTLKEQRQGP